MGFCLYNSRLYLVPKFPVPETEELPSSCLYVLLSASLHYSLGEKVEAVQGPCAMLHRVIVSQGLVLHEAHLGLCLLELASNHVR